MSQPEMCRVPFAAELSFVGDPETGEVAGYGAVFNNIDLNGDMISPGAFDATLAEQKSSGRVLPMFGEHSFAFMGGDPYPIGGWTSVVPDSKGLRVEGKLVGLKHPDVGRAHELIKAKLLPGLSIAFRPRDGGYVKGVKAGEPRRRLTAVDLFSIDVVGDPANPQALIDSVKSTMMMPNHTAAAEAIQGAHQMCADCMGGGDAPTKAERDQIMGNLKEAFRHLTGNDMPAAMMRFEQLRELKKWLHLPVDQGGRGFSSSQADEIAELVFKSLPRDESGDTAAASAARKQVVGEIAGLLSGFSLKFGE
jgi:Escherichia/Staphylococcus phage prohead protease